MFCLHKVFEVINIVPNNKTDTNRRVFEEVKVALEGFIPVLAVALVDRVYVAFVWNFHVLLHHNKLPDVLQSGSINDGGDNDNRVMQ